LATCRESHGSHRVRAAAGRIADRDPDRME